VVRLRAPVACSSPSSDKPLVVSAANGSANRIGPATLQAFSWLRVGDVDGDGYDDVGLTTGVTTTKVEALQSTSGARLWQRAAPPGFPESFPHTGADSRRDDLVWTNYKTVPEGDEVIVVGCTATYVSGRDGKTRWSGVCPAGTAGDADGDGIQNYWIYACGMSGGLAVRSGRTGARLWQWCPASNEYVGGPVTPARSGRKSMVVGSHRATSKGMGSRIFAWRSAGSRTHAGRIIT